MSGKTLGTNLDDCTQIIFWYSSGATNNAVAGNIGVQSGTVAIWGMQTEIAAPGQTQPTPLEKPTPQQELSACQRYYQTFASLSMLTYTTAGGTIGQSITFPQMRAVPNFTPTGITYINASGLVVANKTSTNCFIYAVATAAGGAQWNTNLLLDAEL